MKPIICPVCDCEQHDYIKQVEPGTHEVRCICCGAFQEVDEQVLQESEIKPCQK